MHRTKSILENGTTKSSQPDASSGSSSVSGDGRSAIEIKYDFSRIDGHTHTLSEKGRGRKGWRCRAVDLRGKQARESWSLWE